MHKTLFDTQKLQHFPTQPGVYLMKNQEGEVLYVGKANNIRVRVKQYFVPGRDGRLMIPFLIAKVSQIETVIVSSEKEALLLENTLIKRHQPRYNALLKDDKSYIALKLTTKDQWPAVKVVRYRGQPKPDGLYFGPYTSAKAARQTLNLIHKIFPLRQCSDQELKRRTRPCLLYQMGRCIGPCAGMCSTDEYQVQVARTIKFLKGLDKEVLKDLNDDMLRFSENLEFERAAAVLRTIRHLEKTLEVQHVDRPLGIDADAIALHRCGEEVVVVQLLFRQGRLIGSRQFDFNNIAEDNEDLLSSFIMQQYEKQLDIPQELLLPLSLPDSTALEEILSNTKGSKVKILAPIRGEKRVLLDLAQKNAESLFTTQKDAESLREKLLLELQECCSLVNYPERIECFDNSTISGFEPVSSMVVFTDGQKDSKNYRTYRLKIGTKPNDYAAMYEVLTRRYKRAKEENNLPSLIVVDGGKGHLNIAIQVLQELDIIGVDLIGFAKEEGRHDKGMTSEQIFLVDRKEPILLKKTSPILYFLQKIRDEAHRVAITFHRKRRSKQTIRSALDDIPGIGPAKRKILLSHFGSIKKMEIASEEQMKAVKGISPANIDAIRAFFQGRKEE